MGAPWPEKYAGPSPVPNYDTFHELILIDEICRCGSGGVVWGLVEGLQIGLPPILHFGIPRTRPTRSLLPPASVRRQGASHLRVSCSCCTQALSTSRRRWHLLASRARR